jgi:SAM-dependent methyltransferase
MIIIWLVLILIFISFGLIVAVGAPYVPTKKAELVKLFDHLKVRKGARLLDMGSGDGRVLFLASKKGYKATGYELNPILFAISKLRLTQFKKSKVVLKSYWAADISKADVIFVFSAQPFMNRLLKKLEDELKPGAMVISYGFSFPSRKIDEKFGAFNIYEF